MPKRKVVSEGICFVCIVANSGFKRGFMKGRNPSVSKVMDLPVVLMEKLIGVIVMGIDFGAVEVA